jgi:hypothetical protein
MDGLVEIRGGVADSVEGPVVVVDWDNIGYDRRDDFYVIDQVKASRLDNADKDRIVSAILDMWGEL